MKNSFVRALCLGLMLGSITMSVGCGSEEVPQASKARMFGKTGALAFYGGTTGFYGKILGPGTVYTGVYDTVKVLDCGIATKKETLSAQTKDQVHVEADVYLTYRANCDDDKVVEQTLGSMLPEKGDVISSEQLYSTYIRGPLGEAMRMSIPTVDAFDVNTKRQELHDLAESKFNMSLAAMKAPVVIVTFKINNVTPPKELLDRNANLAAQQVMKNTSIAEMSRVEAETTTAKMRIKLKEAEGDTEAAKIAAIGAALQKYPEYMKYVQLGLLPGIYQNAGEKGNMIMLPSDISMFMQMPTKK